MERAWLLLIIPIVGAVVGALSVDTYPSLLPAGLGGAMMGIMVGFVIAGLTLVGMTEYERRAD